MNEAKRNSSIPGLFVLFIAVTLVGIALSYFYIFFQVNAHEIWFNIVGNFVFGLALAILVWVIKRAMRITNDAMSIIVVILSLAVVVFVMWNMWFVLMNQILYQRRDVDALSDISLMLSATREMIGSGNFISELRYYNARGTWRVEGNQVNGLMLSAVWAGELLVMTVFAIMAAYASVGLYLAERGAWVKVKLMNYGFSAFDDSELDRIASGDIDVILQKPLETRGEAMSAIAVCYHKGEPTEFAAVYSAGWDRDGTLAKGRHIMTVKLGAEKIDALDVGLQAVHYPTVADKIAKEKESELAYAPSIASIPSNGAKPEARPETRVEEAPVSEPKTEKIPAPNIAASSGAPASESAEEAKQADAKPSDEEPAAKNPGSE